MSVFQKTLVLIFSALFLISTQFAFGQKKIKSGVVVYEITKVETNVPELKLMKGTKKALYFTPEKQKVDISLNNDNIKIQTFYNNRTKDIMVYYDFVGQHFKVSSNNKKNNKSKPLVKKIDYKKLETKLIAGYTCYKADITFEDEKVTLWITDKIKVENPDFQHLFPGLVGFPLEYVRRGENTKMTFKATFISELIPRDIFITSKNYTEISEEEFNKKMGGMKFGY